MPQYAGFTYSEELFFRKCGLIDVSHSFTRCEQRILSLEPSSPPFIMGALEVLIRFTPPLPSSKDTLPDLPDKEWLQPGIYFEANIRQQHRALYERNAHTLSLGYSRLAQYLYHKVPKIVDDSPAPADTTVAMEEPDAMSEDGIPADGPDVESGGDADPTVPMEESKGTEEALIPSSSHRRVVSAFLDAY